MKLGWLMENEKETTQEIFIAKKKCESDIKEACNLDKNKPLTAVIVKCYYEIYLKYVICMCVYATLYVHWIASSTQSWTGKTIFLYIHCLRSAILSLSVCPYAHKIAYNAIKITALQQQIKADKISISLVLPCSLSLSFSFSLSRSLFLVLSFWRSLTERQNQDWKNTHRIMKRREANERNKTTQKTIEGCVQNLQNVYFSVACLFLSG